MTSLKDDRLLLISWVSLNRSPVVLLLESLSLPARSIRFKTPWTFCSVFSFFPLIRSVKTKWLLDDYLFICVLPTDLLCAACCRREEISYVLQTSFMVRSETCVFPFASCLIVYCLLEALFSVRAWSLDRFDDNKSLMVSLYISSIDAYIVNFHPWSFRD